MLHAEITHSPRPHLPFRHGILDGLPAGQSRFSTTIGTMQQEEIDVAQTGLLDGLLDGLPNGGVGGVGSEFGGEVDV